MSTDRELLLEIANIVGGPVSDYSPSTAAREWSARAERISSLIQAQIMPCVCVTTNRFTKKKA
jgi:hypothetical protein